MARNAIAARTANPQRKFVDIQYRDLMRNPAKAIEGIYRAHGAPLQSSGEIAAAQAAVSASRIDHRAGRTHAYALSDFGLTLKDVDSTFAEYYAYFNSDMERHIS